jgi:hypothetical protein
MTAPLQLELLADNTSPLFGLKVITPAACAHCHKSVAVIGRATGPHFAELRCATCGTHCGWLSKGAAAWITTVINKFGAPTTPIVLRRRST